MHGLLEWYSSWSATLYSWARTVVGIVLWFWVVSGAIFALRFLAFVLLDRNSGSSRLAAAAAPIPFPVDRIKDESGHESSQGIAPCTLVFASVCG